MTIGARPRLITYLEQTAKRLTVSRPLTNSALALGTRYTPRLTFVKLCPAVATLSKQAFTELYTPPETVPAVDSIVTVYTTRDSSPAVFVGRGRRVSDPPVVFEAPFEHAYTIHAATAQHNVAVVTVGAPLIDPPPSFQTHQLFDADGANRAHVIRALTAGCHGARTALPDSVLSSDIPHTRTSSRT